MIVGENKLRLKPMLGTICILLLALEPVWSLTFRKYYSSHGEICSNSLSLACDPQARLTCFDERCECINRRGMIFEESAKKCVIKAGQSCKYISIFNINPIHSRNNECVENANCCGHGYCACAENFFENPNGTCSPASTYLDPCDSNIRCKAHAGLECQKYICKCNSTAAIYSPDENQCVGLAGQKCINSKCIGNAFCNMKGSCSCLSDHFANSQGKCSLMVDVGEKCSGDEQCRDGKGLICTQGVCSCDPASTVSGTVRFLTGRSSSSNIGPNKTQCFGRVNSPCIDRQCVPNARCLSGVCHCKSGTVSDSNSSACAQGYGNDCSSTLHCVHDLVCNLTAKKCSCRYEGQFYDYVSGRCQSKVGGPCSESLSCVSGAECIKFSNSSHGVCSCKNGQSIHPTRLCELEYGQKCNESTNSCDSLAGLDCIDEVCQCRKFARYSSENRRCLGFVGTTCSQSLNESSECIENAICSSNFAGLMATCNCKVGYALNANYTCELINREANTIPTTLVN